VEVLIPDFQGSEPSLRTVLASPTSSITTSRPCRGSSHDPLGGESQRSLTLLARAAASDRELPTKSGMMLGLGETIEEVLG
jgi:lipoic acid synthetase